MYSVKVQARNSRLTRYLVFRTYEAATGCYTDIKRQHTTTRGLGARFHFTTCDMYEQPTGYCINEEGPIRTDLTRVYKDRIKDKKFID